MNRVLVLVLGLVGCGTAPLATDTGTHDTDPLDPPHTGDTAD